MVIAGKTFQPIRFFHLSFAVAGVCWAALGATQGLAQEQRPLRAARLTFVEGDVTVEQPGGSVTETGVVNAPLIEGLSIATGRDGQAEIEFEDGSLARLTPNSKLALAEMTVESRKEYRTRLALAHGLAYFELRAGSKYLYRVQAGDDTFEPVENSTLRLAMDEPPATVAVLDGKIRVVQTGGFHAVVRVGESLRADRTDGSRYFLSPEIAAESWDSWNEARDQVAADALAKRTAARDAYAGDHGYGWSDLDAYGSWYDYPGEGRVWRPTVATYADFDPYGYGNWVYYPSSGYVWASSYAWGWTPFRCGNWSYFNGFGWGWAPTGCVSSYGFWGGYGPGFTTIYSPTYVTVVNVTRCPPGYRPLPVPIVGPGPVHPILRVSAGTTLRQVEQGSAKTPVLLGHPIEALRPVGGGYTARGGSAVGSPLRKDFPVDGVTHEAVLGVAPVEVASPVLGSGWRTVSPHTVAPVVDVARPSYPRSPDAGTRTVWAAEPGAPADATRESAGASSRRSERSAQRWGSADDTAHESASPGNPATPANGGVHPIYRSGPPAATQTLDSQPVYRRSPPVAGQPSQPSRAGSPSSPPVPTAPVYQPAPYRPAPPPAPVYQAPTYQPPMVSPRPSPQPPAATAPVGSNPKRANMPD